MKAKPFQPPTPDQVAAYAREIGYDKLAADPGRFCDYYETCGWRTNHGPMRNWQAAVRNWRRMDAERGMNSVATARAEEDARRKEAEARMREVVARYAREWVVADGWQRNPAPVPLGDTGRFLRGPENPEKEKRLIEAKARDAYGEAGSRMLRECIREVLAEQAASAAASRAGELARGWHGDHPRQTPMPQMRTWNAASESGAAATVRALQPAPGTRNPSTADGVG